MKRRAAAHQNALDNLPLFIGAIVSLIFAVITIADESGQYCCR